MSLRVSNLFNIQSGFEHCFSRHSEGYRYRFVVLTSFTKFYFSFELTYISATFLLFNQKFLLSDRKAKFTLYTAVARI